MAKEGNLSAGPPPIPTLVVGTRPVDVRDSGTTEPLRAFFSGYQIPTPVSLNPGADAHMLLHHRDGQAPQGNIPLLQPSPEDG